MNLNDWFAFLKDCDLIGTSSVDDSSQKKMLKSSAELMFVRLNWITDASGRKVKNADTQTNSDRSLVITEFCVGLLRLSKALRSKKDKNEMLSETLAKFMNDRIIPFAKFVDVEPFRSRLRAKRVCKIFQRNKNLITQIFEKYAYSENSVGAAGLRTIDLGELVDLVKHIVKKIKPHHRQQQREASVGIKFLVVQQIFGLSQKEVLGEDAGEIDREEFDELIGRLAESFHDASVFIDLIPSSSSSAVYSAVAGGAALFTAQHARSSSTNRAREDDREDDCDDQKKKSEERSERRDNDSDHSPSPSLASKISLFVEHYLVPLMS